MKIENIRRATAVGLASAAIAVGTFTATTPANASPVASKSHETVVAGTHPSAVARSGATRASARPGPGWYYYGSYFWGADCTYVGNYGINNGWWSAYQCDGNWFRDYDLWY